MLFWSLAIAVTAIACAALYYASLRRAVGTTGNVEAATDDATTAHYKKQLSEIEAAIHDNRLSAAEGLEAKGELAREVLRLQKERPASAPKPSSLDQKLLPLAILSVAILAIGTYSFIGAPQLPSQPLAGRPDVAAQNMDLNQAVSLIEAQLKKTPDDVKGWSVIAPVYVQMGRYADAAKALRRVNELAPPTADSQTDLAEVLMMLSNGDASGEPLELLKNAAALDPTHVRSRFYLAQEAMRTMNYADAVTRWKALIALAKPEDPWLAIAQTNLASAEATLAGKPLPAAGDDSQQQMIKGMVDGLSARLYADGGTIEEWTQLVRSLIVLNDIAGAQKAYDKAKLAYPAAFDRADLDSLAASAGLELNGAKP